MKIFLNGSSGTIGSRILKILHNHVEVVLGKHSGTMGQMPSYAKEYPFYLADGPDYAQRAEQAKTNGLNVKGKISDLNFTDFDLILDATDGKATPEYVEMYRKSGKPFMIQGGFHKWPGTRFVSLPHIPLHMRRELQQLSCNETYLSTMVDLLLHCFFVEDFATINATLYRRVKDPEDDKKMEYDVSVMEENTHHKVGVISVIPELSTVMTTRANKNPWMHFHRPHTLITFKQDVTEEQIERLRQEFRAYERCVYAEADMINFAHDPAAMNLAIAKLIEVGKQAAIPDGDLLLPIYTIRRAAPNVIEIIGFTPQRSITIPSTIDYLRMLERREKSHHEVFTKTNADFFWYGNNITQLKTLLTKKINALPELTVKTN